MELEDQSPQDDATLMKLIELLEEVDELMWSGRVPRRADRGISRFNLPKLYSRTGTWEPYLAWMRREIEQESSPRVKASWLSAMARMAAQNLGDLTRAVSFLKEGIALDPTAEEAARAVLTVLRVRNIAVPKAAHERILAEKEPETLERWLERAIVAASLAEVLDDPS
jgi:hypothetical protein